MKARPALDYLKDKVMSPLLFFHPALNPLLCSGTFPSAFPLSKLTPPELCSGLDSWQSPRACSLLKIGLLIYAEARSCRMNLVLEWPLQVG